MAGKFSTEAMQAMGFRLLEPELSIAAAFTSITVYEARGITLKQDVLETIESTCDGFEYRVAFAPSVNAACQALLSDAYADDEEEWKREHGCNGPYVLVAVGPTAEYTCRDGWYKEEHGGSITTYDAFPELSGELTRREELILPRVRTALTCVLNGSERYVNLHKVDRTSAGVTPEGKTIHNIRIDFRGEGYVSRDLPGELASELISQAESLVSKLNPRTSGLFALGLAETDEFKKFLYFFLALEIETHAAFGKTDRKANLHCLIGGSAVSRTSVAALFERQSDQLRGLFDRFVWCAAFAWSNVDDDDVDDFRKLKKARDDIAHGNTTQPPAGSARLAEKLVHKVLWQR